jgi:hypothetical protein
VFARHAAAERLVELDLLLTELRLFLAVISAEEHHLVAIVLETGFLEDLAQRNAGPPAVAREALDPPAAVARAFEPGDDLFFAHRLQLVQRKRLRALDQARHLQAERRRIDRGMPVVLGRKELILRRQPSRDRADVEHANHLARVRGEVCRDVREGHDRLALRERGHGPFGEAQKAESRGGEAAPEHRATAGDVLC